MNARTVTVVLGLGALAACVATAPIEDMSPPSPPSSQKPPPEPDYSLDPRQKDEPSDRTLWFYYGPMKPMLGESILYSVASFTGHSFGSWDYTAPDPSTQGFADAGNGANTMYRHCTLFGGCMEHRIPLGRTSFVGTAYVLELERAVVEACADRRVWGMFPGDKAPDTTVLPVDVIRHQYKKAFGDAPTDVDLAASLTYFTDHMAAPESDAGTPLESAGRGHCRALLTTNRFLYY